MTPKAGMPGLLSLLIFLSLTACGGGGSGSSNPSSGTPSAGGGNTPGTLPVGPDVTAPGILGTTPADNGLGTPSTSGIQVVFNEAMKAADPGSIATDTDPSRINASTVLITDNSGASVQGTLHYAGNTVTFTPDASLAPASFTFRITVKSTVQDLAGNALGSDRTFSFTTPMFMGKGVARDSSGNLYFVGSATGNLGPVINNGAKDLFLIKVPADGSLPWTRLIGSMADEDAAGVALDAAGNIYVAGTTGGALPNLSTGSTTSGGSDVFAIKFDPNGLIQWTQQMGTAEDQTASGIAVGSDGVYITGYTRGGPGFIGGTDAFLVKINLADGQRQWVHLVGTTGNERGQAVAVDGSGVYMAGYAESTLPNVPVEEAYKGAGDIFLVKYDTAGTQQLWAHQRGTSANDVVTGLALDAAGNAYLAGQTNGQLDGGVNASGSSGGTHDVFLMKYNAGGAYQWTKQTGSQASEQVSGVAADASGIYVSGLSYGALPGFSANAGLSDLFVLKFSADPVAAGSPIALWYQQKGTLVDDLTGGIALDGSGNSYTVGATTAPLAGTSLLAGSTSLTDRLFYTRLNADGTPL